MAAPNVRFSRDITVGCRGKDVTAHKRAISRAVPARYPWHDFSDYCGIPFMQAVQEWKRSKNMMPRLRPVQVAGIYSLGLYEFDATYGYISLGFAERVMRGTSLLQT